MGPSAPNIRLHGRAPFAVAVLHGGPGATGAAAPLARALAAGGLGVLEPLQTALTLDGQVEELRAALSLHAHPPVTLIGHSWGAWLALITAARHPEGIGKLILVGCGPLEEADARGIMAARLARLGRPEREEFDRLMRALAEHEAPEPAATSNGQPPCLSVEAVRERLGAILTLSDAFDPLPPSAGDPPCAFRPDIFRAVWPQAEALRRRGGLLSLARRIRCPVVAIHGKHDPHPAAGVERPLRWALADFRFILLPRCGHEPWRERHAAETFFRYLRAELPSAVRN